ncbi:hypothetical protein D3C71_1215090 [compost metagenome]
MGRVQASHGVPAAVAGDGACLQIPVPQAQRCRRDGEREQFLAFPYLLFIAFAVGDVVHREQPARLAIEFGGAHGLQHGAGWAATHIQVDLVAAQVARALHLRNQLFAVVRGENAQLDRSTADGLLARDAQHVHPGGVDVHIASVASVRQAHGVGHELKDARETLFGLAQALLGALGLVDVLHHAAYAGHAPVFDHRLAHGAHPHQPTVGVQHLDLHAPLAALQNAQAEVGAQRFAVGGRHMAVDVVVGQRRTGGQAVDVKTHV